MEEYHLKQFDHIPPENEQILYAGISEEAGKSKGLEPILPYSVFIFDADQKVVGGISGVTFYGSLYVDALWVTAKLRGKGWGSKLMEEAHKIGKERGSTFATLNTMDWEALPFYQKLGYSIEFIREGYAKNSKMYLLKKVL